MSREEVGKLGIISMVAAWNNGMPEDDEEYIAETLWKTRDGSCFLYGEGGAMTYYSRFLDGADVKQVSKADALAWCEERGVQINMSIQEGEVA